LRFLFQFSEKFDFYVFLEISKIIAFGMRREK